MHVKNILPLALASVAAAQSETPSLVEALSANNATLSSLSQLLNTQPEVLELLRNAENVTILAPNNDALSAFTSSSAGEAAASDPGLIAAVLQYHVLNGTYYASNLSETSDSELTAAHIIPTLLTNETYTNVTGGQRLEVVPSGDNVTFYSALREPSNVVTADLNFTGGVIHVIDTVLSLPQNASTTLRDANLTAALGAVELAELGETLDTAEDITIFIPDNDAFARIGSLAGELSVEDLQEVLAYHVVEGTVLYSDLITENTTVETFGDGEDLNVSIIDGSVFINNAQVIVQDVLIANGVVHVINNVLNPNDDDEEPEPTASTPAPAFSGASTASGGANPFTSGVEGPTSTAPVATGANPGGEGAAEETGEAGDSTSTEDAGAAMQTGAVGVAALFGAGVIAMNL